MKSNQHKPKAFEADASNSRQHNISILTLSVVTLMTDGSKAIADVVAEFWPLQADVIDLRRIVSIVAKLCRLRAPRASPPHNF